MSGTDMGTCSVCGYRMLPILPLLPCGHDAEPTVEPLTATGTVHSWTTTDGAEGPITIAMADFFGGDLRITAPVVGTEMVAVGSQVVLEPGRGTPYAFACVTP